jgi:FSR family fosmidomycin resistance protein-like MFS transporter
MSLLRNRSLMTVSLGHFTIDVFNSMSPVLLAFFSVPMGLSNTQIGLAAGLYTLVASLFQPVFGWLTDRHGSHWLGAFSLLWTLGWLSLAVTLGQRGVFLLLIIPFVLAGLGSAAYHPQGTMHATDVGADQQASGAAIFFFFGHAGLGLGPAIAGLILGQVGPTGIPMLALFGLPVVLMLARALGPGADHADKGDLGREVTQAHHLALGAVLALVWLVALRSWANFGITTFLPKFYQARGWSPESYGMVSTIFMIGSATGGVFGGPAADRWGRRLIVASTLLAATLPLLILPLADGAAIFVLAAAAGALLGASQSIIVVLAQTLLPGSKATASGLILGFMFACGAIGGVVNGWMADRIGLTLTLQSVALIAFGAALCALALPATRTAISGAETEGSPA